MKNGKPYLMHLCVEHQARCGQGAMKDQIASAIAGMSCESRMQRFAAPITGLSDSQLDYLTDLDGTDRVAWCAYLHRENGDRGIGLARYVRLADTEGAAEFAVTVVDEFQGQGIGSELLRKLMESARSNSIETLIGYILSSNKGMLALSRRFGAATVQEDSSLIRADIPIKA
jgi:acetyltransferase